MEQTTQNFVLALSWQNPSWQAQVLESPAGEARARFELPFSFHALMHWANNHTDLEMLVEPTETEQDHQLHNLSATDIGVLLYKTLFTGRVKEVFDKTRTFCEENGQNLRIVLRFDTHSEKHLILSSMPWEMLCDPSTNVFFCHEKHVTLVRHLEQAHHEVGPPLPAPLKVLAVIPNPTGDKELQVNTFDRNEHLALLQKISEEEPFSLHILEKPTLEALYLHLLDHEYDVLHFTGHGGFYKDNAVLLFEDENGRCDPVADRRFVSVVRSCPRLRLVHLVSCQTANTASGKRFSPFHGLTHALIGAKIPAVVAMQFLINVQDAYDYVTTFYDRIAKGEPLDKAVDDARIRLWVKRNNNLTWATPVVFLRNRDARLYTLPESQRLHINAFELLHPKDQRAMRSQQIEYCNLTPFFTQGDGARTRRIVHPDNWASVKSELKYWRRTLSTASPVHFEGKCPLSVWFTVGYIFQQSTRFIIAYQQFNQRTKKLEWWHPNPQAKPMAIEASWPGNRHGDEMVVSVNSVDPHMEQNVGVYLAEIRHDHLPWLQLSIADADRRIFKDGQQANGFCNAVIQKITALRAQKIHLFLAVPSAVALFIARELHVGKQFEIYEYQNPGYTKAFSLGS
ncbi:CHAT domain-containing protein [Acanthopleuribacter pedis]|uniref:CHAT domain-containing protein n=1 Tax=Acanthopleuribacter pedis TaxID=442870 RepID=A0A8J7U1Z9_9BACT|nr:CHAT domain-containing protein [Acanthopleuribacter pedis]MBO1318077.1 CHAT domain-containing protein [Acanthopleuribacter pedis]